MYSYISVGAWKGDDSIIHRNAWYPVAVLVVAIALVICFMFIDVVIETILVQLKILREKSVIIKYIYVCR